MNWENQSLDFMAAYALNKIYEEIGPCTLIAEPEDFSWQEVTFKPEKFPEALDLLILDLKDRKIKRFIKTIVPEWAALFTQHMHTAEAWGIFLRFHKRYDYRTDPPTPYITIDYRGKP